MTTVFEIAGKPYTGATFIYGGLTDQNEKVWLPSSASADGGRLFSYEAAYGSGGTRPTVLAYDTDTYASPALAELDNLSNTPEGTAWGMTSIGAAGLVTALGLDADRVLADYQQSGADPLWVGSPEGVLKAAVRVDPGLATPQVSDYLARSDVQTKIAAGEKFGAVQYAQSHPALSWNTEDTISFATGVAAVVGAAGAFGAFSGASAAAGTGTATTTTGTAAGSAGWVSGYDLAMGGNPSWWSTITSAYSTAKPYLSAVNTARSLLSLTTEKGNTMGTANPLYLAAANGGTSGSAAAAPNTNDAQNQQAAMPASIGKTPPATGAGFALPFNLTTEQLAIAAIAGLAIWAMWPGKAKG